MPADPIQLQAAFGQIVCDGSLREPLRDNPDAALTKLGLDERDRTGMLSLGPKRLLVYHEMVHARLLKTIRSFMDGAADRIGDQRMRAEVREWIAAHGPTSRYLRDVATEFVAWATPRWQADESLPPWIAEYCDHAVSIRAIRNDPRPVGTPTDIKLELERPILFNATTRLFRYRWAVHRLPTPLPPDRDPVDLRGKVVVGFRHPEDEQPHFFELDPRSAELLERLLATQTLRDALFGACAATGETLDDTILSATAVLLADLADRRVLLGG